MGFICEHQVFRIGQKRIGFFRILLIFKRLHSRHQVGYIDMASLSL